MVRKRTNLNLLNKWGGNNLYKTRILESLGILLTLKVGKFKELFVYIISAIAPASLVFVKQQLMN